MYSSPARSKLRSLILPLYRRAEPANIYADSVLHVSKLNIIWIDCGIAPDIILLRKLCNWLICIFLIITLFLLFINQSISLLFNLLESILCKICNGENNLRTLCGVFILLL